MKYVYLINEIGTDNYKIGKALDANDRVGRLQTGNSTPLKLMASFKTYDYTLLEKILHNTFKNNNILREWFNFKPKILHEVLSIMYNACMKVNKESELYEESIVNNAVEEPVVTNAIEEPTETTYINSQGKTERKCNKCNKIFTKLSATNFETRLPLYYLD